MLVDIINGTQGTRKQIKVLPNLLRMQKEVGKYSSTNHRQTFLEREFEVFQSDRRGRSVVFFCSSSRSLIDGWRRAVDRAVAATDRDEWGRRRRHGAALTKMPRRIDDSAPLHSTVTSGWPASVAPIWDASTSTSSLPTSSVWSAPSERATAAKENQ